MKQLIIDESKWVNGSNKGHGPEDVGPSQLLNDRGNMCCLGFYALSCKYTPKQIKNVGSLYTLVWIINKNKKIKGKIPKKVFAPETSQGNLWESKAIWINDDRELTLKSRKLRLINHFKKINIKLSFTKSK